MSEKTIFACTLKNNKKVEVCDLGEKIQYKYGRLLAKPELKILKARGTFLSHPWNGYSSENYGISISASGVTYETFFSVSKINNQPYAGLIIKSKTEKVFICKEKSLINNMEGFR